MKSIQLQLVQTPLEAVAEQRAERLTLPHPIEQMFGQPDALGRKIDRQQIAHFRGGMRQMAVAQQRDGRGLRERRRVDKARIVRRLKNRRLLSPAGRRRPRSAPVRASDFPPNRSHRNRRRPLPFSASCPGAWRRRK